MMVVVEMVVVTGGVRSHIGWGSKIIVVVVVTGGNGCDPGGCAERNSLLRWW